MLFELNNFYISKSQNLQSLLASKYHKNEAASIRQLFQLNVNHNQQWLELLTTLS